MIIGTHAYNALLWVKHHEMLSATERNLIGRRTQSDRTANAIQSDTERNPTRKLGCSIRKDTPKDWHRLDF